MANKFAAANTNASAGQSGWGALGAGGFSEFPKELYIFQKDSKSITVFNTQTQNLTHKYVEYRGNFPHNFQMIQVGIENPRVFMLGGGDYKSLPDSMFMCKELIPDQSTANYNLKFREMKRMKYARHGHSCCQVGNRYILVSGSRKEVSGAANRVELFDTEINDWMELSKINEGRHYHSSCNFNDRFIFIFGGIQN